MPPLARSARIFRFGLFEADALRGTLSRDGSRLRIQEQPCRVLFLLLERSGEIVTREQLRQELWQDDTFVDFDGSLNVILRKLRSVLHDDSENPVFIETVPRKGYRFIAPVAVETAGADRQEPLADAVKELLSSYEEDETAAFAKRPRSPSLHLLYIATAVILVVFAVLEWTGRRKSPNPGTAPVQSAAATVIPRKSIAVLGFQNLSGHADDGWLATAFSEMLSTELAAGEKLRMVSGEDVANLRLSSPWSQTDTLGPQTTARIGTALNSDVLVLGSYTSLGKSGHRQVRIDVRLQEARTGEILTEVADSGNGDNIFPLVSRIGARIRNRLVVPNVSEIDQPSVLASLPDGPEAARLYTLGLVKLREYDCGTARDLLEQAVKADPKFPLSHSMLARAWAQLGYEQKRRAEARKALDLSANLSRIDRMLVEGNYYESLADHASAASTYRALFALLPDSVEYGLQLAVAQTAAGQRSQARETIAQLRRLSGQAANDPRIDLVEERAIPTDKSAELVLIENALAKAKKQDKNLVYAQGRKEECMNLIYGSDPKRGALSCEDASRIFLAAGNRLAAADALRLIGDSQGALGHPTDAIATYRQALLILKGLGEEHAKTGAIYNNMAGAFINTGQLNQAEQFYRKAKYHFEQTGDRLNTGTAVGNIADVLYLRGKLVDAAKLYQEAIDSEASLDPSAPGYAMYRLADLRLAQGETRTAHDLAAQAVEIMRPTHGAYQTLTGAMIVLADALLAGADFSDARKQYQDALELRQKLGEQELVAESQTSLAELSLEEGHPEQAESFLRSAITEFEKEKETPSATGAYTLLSRALLFQGKLQQARDAVQRAAELGHNNPDPALTLPVIIEKARIGIAADPGHARSLSHQLLLPVIATARKLGYYQIECEALLVLSEAELRGHPDSSAAQLSSLEKATHDRGLELLSRKAQSLVSPNVPFRTQP